MAEYRMPSLGADMKDGRVVEWFVAPGDRVRRGDVVGVVDTAKGAIEMEIWTDATVEEIVAPPGTKVPVGEVLLRLREGAEEEAGAAPPPSEGTAPPEAEVPAEPVQPAAVTSEVASPEAPPPAAPPAPAPSSAPDRRPPTTLVRASPAARKLAAAHGVDLAGVRGTGPEGAVVLEDVEALVEGAGVAAAEGPEIHATPVARRMAEVHGVDLSAVQGTGPHGTVTREDVAAAVGAGLPEASRPEEAPEPSEAEARQQSMREAIAAAMARSKREIPHYYLQSTADMEAVQAWLARENADRPPAERILPVALLLKAVARAVDDFPEMNGHYTEGAYRPAQQVHLGLAVSLRSGGLVAPAIRDTDRRTLADLSRGVVDVVQRARAGRLRSSEMTDGTLTVSSLGDRGVEAVFGVIYPPQVALVGFGRVMERPWAEHGLLGVRRAVTVTLAGDHRVSDGHRGGLFLEKIGMLLQKPEEL